MRSSLRRDHRMDLVDDHALNAAKSVAREAREDQVERLGRGDEDVRGLALIAGSIARRGVACPDGNGRLAVWDPETLRLPRDADERLSQVSFDIDRERLEWR